MKKWLVTFMIGMLFVTIVPGSVLAAQPISVVLDGEKLNFDVPPQGGKWPGTGAA